MLLADMLALSLTLPPSSLALVLFCLSLSGFAVWPWPSSWALCLLGAPGTMRANLVVCVFWGLCEDMPERQRLACVPLLRSLSRVPALMLVLLPYVLLLGWQSLYAVLRLLSLPPRKGRPSMGYVYRGPFVICN